VVEALALPHDAPHVALRVTAGDRRFGIATDLGHVPRELHGFLSACDHVLLESNYCPRMLEAGPYPERLKRRVAGPVGHLANEQAAELARALENTRVSRLVLGHLSRTNNVPSRALDVVASRAHRLGVEVLPHGEPRYYDVAAGAGPRAAEQLSLGF
jgi:phosphoribosyl 1,2-cyclic phosphodiesterase